MLIIGQCPTLNLLKPLKKILLAVRHNNRTDQILKAVILYPEDLHS